MSSDGNQPAREQWGSKLGVILAVAGSAVGLGNFLRFPGQAAANGGGAFMIPYFLAFLIVGIPICWVEWTMGRYGGRFGFNSSPGIFSVLWRNRWSKYIGALGLMIPVVIYMYYVYIESWCLAYMWYYLTGQLDLGKNPAAYGRFFEQQIGSKEHGAIFRGGIQAIFWFFVATFVVNFIFIYRGLSKGIETFCKFAMPLLIISAIVVAGRVLTLPEQPLPLPWHLSLRESLPPAPWQELQALASNPETPVEKIKETLQVRFDDYFTGLLESKPGYKSDARVAPPAGFEASNLGLAVNIAELRDSAKGSEYREWVNKTLLGLSTNEKLELQDLEVAEKNITSDNEQAQSERGKLDARREQILNASAPMPSLENQIHAVKSATPITNGGAAQRRSAALEVSALPRTVYNGLGYMWNPDFRKLVDPQVWLAAAGQIFFSLSVGFGVILNYASYLRKNDDVVLSGLTASATNEFCEVCLGGLVAIPATFLFLSTTMTLEAVRSNSFGLGFNTLPLVFANMPGGRWIGALWFALLFIAAITSSLSMLQPAIAFLEEGLGLKRRVSVATLGMLTASGALSVIYFSKDLVALSVMDDWVGTVAIYILATIQVLVFSCVFGIDRGLDEAHRGALLRIPAFFRGLILYVTPTFLLVILGAWVFQTLPKKIVEIQQNPEALLTLLYLAIIFIFLLLLISLAGERWEREGRGQKEVDA